MSTAELSTGKTMELFQLYPNRSNSEPNRLIEAKNEFTLLEMKLFFLIVHQLQSNLDTVPANTNKVIKIPSAKKLLGGPSKSNMISMVDGIKQKELKWMDDSGDYYDAVTPFPRVTYENGNITVTILADVLPTFQDLTKGFTQYGITGALKLRSKYSTKLYRMLCRWRSTGLWKKVNVENLKRDLGAEEYSWAMFRTRVLEKAQDEINDVTDINFHYTVVKKSGNKVTHLDFMIGDLKTMKNISLTDGGIEMDTRTKRALEYCDQLGIYNEDIRKKIITSHLDEFWKVIYEYNLSKKKISSPSGFVLSKLGLVKAKEPTVDKKPEQYKVSLDSLREIAEAMDCAVDIAAKKLGYKIEGEVAIKE